MDYLKKIMTDFELHSVDGIRDCFESGMNPNAIVNGKPLIYSLINMYTRGPSFKQCMKTFMDYGLEFDDKVLLSVLLDDADQLGALLTTNADAVTKKYSFDCTFTPLHNVSLLHICAEYNHLACAKILVQYGADVNSKAGLDHDGFGGHTPIFHTVNQHANACMDVMRFLISKNADLAITVKGLIWGKNYEWETFIPAVNPLSYAMMGLLRQFQRTELQIYEVVSILFKARYGEVYHPKNIPNRYLLG